MSDCHRNLIKKVRELEATIQKMKCCENCRNTCIQWERAFVCHSNSFKYWELKDD